MKRILTTYMIILCILACSKNASNATKGSSDQTSTTLNEPGFGPSQKPFRNASWQLPAGIELQDSIHDYSYCWAFAPYTQVPAKDWRGIPIGFTFCLTLRNKTNTPIVIPFPPELVFASSSFKHQNVLVIEIGNVEMLPGAVKTIVAQGFCLNQGRSIPQTFVDDTEKFLTYSFGPSQLPTALKEITDIIHEKHFSMTDVVKPDGNIDNTKAGKYVAIQAAIWEVTDKQGLTAGTRKQLQEL